VAFLRTYHLIPLRFPTSAGCESSLQQLPLEPRLRRYYIKLSHTVYLVILNEGKKEVYARRGPRMYRDRIATKATLPIEHVLLSPYRRLVRPPSLRFMALRSLCFFFVVSHFGSRTIPSHYLEAHGSILGVYMIKHMLWHCCL
jgi:hypothetical protein